MSKKVIKIIPYRFSYSERNILEVVKLILKLPYMEILMAKLLLTTLCGTLWLNVTLGEVILISIFERKIHMSEGGIIKNVMIYD